MTQEETSKAIPLCIDLDGTLLKTDMLWESLLLLIKKKIFYVLFLPFWLAKGRASFKHEVAKRVTIEPQTLPYRLEVLSYLETQKKKGRTLILVTASDVQIAGSIADEVGLFSDVLASDQTINLKGVKKQKVLDDRFGRGGYDYIGNAKSDVPIWRHAHSAIVVGSSHFQRQVSKIVSVTDVFETKSVTLKTLIRVLRLQQWVKNLLLFVPIIAAHLITDFNKLLNAFFGFFAFGLCASSVYIVNDLLDLTADRVHPEKRKRPLAASDVPIAWGFCLFIFLLMAGLSVAFSVSLFLGLAVFIYLILANGYSIYLKRIALIDIIMLSFFYTIRMYSGGLAAEVPVSFWLLAFSVFLFFSLGIAKRYVALHYKTNKGVDTTKGRGYDPHDLQMLSHFGVISGFLSVLILALYINSMTGGGGDLYRRPQYLWLMCLVLLYWICRIWLLVGREKMIEDPVEFAVKDKQSYIIAVLVVITMFFAI
ncbi:MAG: UbiA family prenyltransferase [Kiritimatiellae bacterium]|nr:UbiA family prenyltransferase [Kiritimatiellia bacterium]